MSSASGFPTASDLLRARYRAADPESPAQWNEAISLLLSHRSVRNYLPKSLPPGTLETLVAAAQSASTSSNLQNWSVVAVEDPERKARLSAIAGSQKHIVEAPLFLVWLADLSRLQSIARGLEVPSDELGYIEYLVMAVIDATLAAQNAFIALESLGLGGVYIGGLRNHPEKVAAELGLPPLVFPVFGMTVGFPDPTVETGVKPRLPQAAVLHREHYSNAATPAAVSEYEARLRLFQRDQKLEEIAWSRQAATRIKRLTGRERLAEALRNLAFPLR